MKRGRVFIVMLQVVLSVAIVATTILTVSLALSPDRGAALIVASVDLVLCVLLVAMFQARNIFRSCRSQWVINEGKTFWVENDDDPAIESRLKELIDPSLMFSRYPFMPRPAIRRLYLAIPVGLLAFMAEVAFAQEFVQKAGLFATCMLAAFFGLLGGAAIIGNQRLREGRWKPYPVNR